MNNKITIIPFTVFFGIFISLGVFIIKGDLKNNRTKIEIVKEQVNNLANQLEHVSGNINAYNQELSALNIKVSVLNVELNYFK